jgi:hypothetical protein
VKLTAHFHLGPRSRLRGAMPPLPHYVFMAWCLVEHRDNLTFYLYRTCVYENRGFHGGEDSSSSEV